MDADPEQVPRGMHAPVAKSLAAETVPGVRRIGQVCHIRARSLHRAPGADREQPV